MSVSLFGFSRALGVAALLALSGCSPSPAPSRGAGDQTGVPVTISQAQQITLDRVLPVVGTLAAKDEATLAAEVEGKVEKTMADFGDRLKEGQALAQIDTSAYEALVLQADANLARASSLATNAAANLRRTRSLSRDGIAAAVDLDQAEASYDQALAEARAASAGHAIAKLNLDKSRVSAPFDGVVSERIASVGDYVKIGSPLFRVVNDETLKLIVQAPERYASQITKDQEISFSVDAWPGERFSGKVFLISPSINTGTRAFALGALVDNRARRLKANSFARGELTLEKAVPCVMVPLEAILQTSGANRVFVYDHQVARSRAVEVGRIQKGLQEITAGLKPGEWVITSGHYRLIDGSKVRLREEAIGSQDRKH